MFYFSETRYLYQWNKVGSSYVKGDLLGFARIVMRDAKGSIKIQFNNAAVLKFSVGNLVIYEGKREKISRIVTTKTIQLQQKEETYSFDSKEVTALEDGIWFDCVIELSGGGMIGERADFYIKSELPTKSYKQIMVLPKQEEAPTQVICHQKEENACVYEEQGSVELGQESVPNKQIEAAQEQFQRKETTKDNMWKSIYVTDLDRLSDKNPGWMKYRSNSFLLHGYYNYKHVIATDTVLGVPGNYYDKEKQVAGMFGFPIFVPVKELEVFLAEERETDAGQLSPSVFGYYIRQEF